MTKHIETRARLKDIAEVQTFTDLINRCTLSSEDKLLLELHYLEGKDLRYIGDELGYSEGAIKKRHRKALKKINQIL